MKTPGAPDLHSDAFLNSLMRRQLRLSMLCAVSFLAALLGLPLANFLFPEWMAAPCLGFPLSWLLLGIGFFPAVWLIAWVFIRRSIRLEEQEVREARAAQAVKSAQAPRS